VSGVGANSEIRETRSALLRATERALESLGSIEDGVLEMRSADAVRGATADVRRMLQRGVATIALVGERETGALLDAWLPQPVFRDRPLSSPGPAIALRRDASAAFRVLRRGGSEHLDDAPSERELTLRAELEAMRRSDPSLPISIEIEIPELPPRPKRGLWRRFVDWLRSLFGTKPALPAPPPTAAPTPAPRRENTRDRLLRELDHAEEERSDDFARRLMELATADDVTELAIAHAMDENLTLLDLRGLQARDAKAAWKRVRAEVDVCILVIERKAAERVAFTTVQLARELSGISPHLWTLSPDGADTLARVLEVDAARIVSLASPLDAASLMAPALDERALSAAVRTIAALRLAQQGIDEKIEAAAARDREVCDRIASYALPPGKKRRDDTHRRVSGAVAGRAARILGSVIGILGTELAQVRSDRSQAIEAVKTKDALKVEVAQVGPALRAVRTKLAGYAEALLHEAMSELGPALLSDVERKIEATLEDLEHVSPARPRWPAAPRIEVPEDGLVAHATLAGGETLRADIGWTDALRSLEKVKQRVGQQLAQELEHLSSAAEAEILDFEPHIARRLQESLELWVDAASDAFNVWLDRCVAEERRARDRAREEKLASLIAARDALRDQGEQVAELNRVLTQRGRRARDARAAPG
jgi:hypothetical protein